MDDPGAAGGGDGVRMLLLSGRRRDRRLGRDHLEGGRYGGATDSQPEAAGGADSQ